MSLKTLILMVVAGFLLGACIKAKPFKPPGEMDGPGLFTGKSGELTIYRSRTRTRHR